VVNPGWIERRNDSPADQAATRQSARKIAPTALPVPSCHEAAAAAPASVATKLMVARKRPLAKSIRRR
jgi:hypothetical protein